MYGLHQCVEEASKKEFKWGIDLADALIAGQLWKTQLWYALLNAWAAELEKRQFEQVIERLDEPLLFKHHALSASRVLEALVSQHSRTYSAELLPSANEIAKSMWPYAAMDFEIIASHDWYARAINQAPGRLAAFWLESLLIGLRAEQVTLGPLADPYHTALNAIVEDLSPAGSMACSVLMSGFAFLLYADESWARERLLPLLVGSPESDDYQAAWDGLMYGRLTIEAIEALKDPFLCAAAEITKFRHLNTRKSFAVNLARLVIDIIEDPIEEWIPNFLLNSECVDRQNFGMGDISAP